MKINLIYLSLAALIATFSSCGPKTDDAPDPAKEKSLLLQNNGNNWVLKTTAGVIKDSYDVSSQFQGFTLKFGDGTFDSTNGLPEVWPSDGTWSFKTEDLNTIIRNDGTEIALVLNGSSLTLSFTGKGSALGGRFESVDGEYVFNLVSQ